MGLAPSRKPFSTPIPGDREVPVPFFNSLPSDARLCLGIPRFSFLFSAAEVRVECCLATSFDVAFALSS
jgi:hypothetical protein